MLVALIEKYLSSVDDMFLVCWSVGWLGLGKALGLGFQLGLGLGLGQDRG